MTTDPQTIEALMKICADFQELDDNAASEHNLRFSWAIIAAIRRGEVPNVYHGHEGIKMAGDLSRMTAEIADLKARLEQTRRELINTLAQYAPPGHPDHSCGGPGEACMMPGCTECGCPTMGNALAAIKERDDLKARLEKAEREVNRLHALDDVNKQALAEQERDAAIRDLAIYKERDAKHQSEKNEIRQQRDAAIARVRELEGLLRGGITAIADERQRQITQEGWTPQHDDEHAHGQLASAAAVYALCGAGWDEESAAERYWPWHSSWLKTGDVRRCLVKAGALIAAEIDRMDRSALDGGVK